MPTIKVILLGGMQEPGHGAGSVLYALLRHPEQLAEVAADLDGLLPAAIDEGMRWVSPSLDPPIGTQGRRTTRGLELGGAELPADAPVAAVISSANRDEARFERPDRFDIHRERQRLATFGFGRHFCSGTHSPAPERIALRGCSTAPARARPEPEVSGWEFRAPRELQVRCGTGPTRIDRSAGYSALADRERCSPRSALIAEAWESFERPRPEEPAIDDDVRERLGRAAARAAGRPRPGARRRGPDPRRVELARRGRSISPTSARPGSRSGSWPRRWRRPTTSTSRSPRAPPTCSRRRRSTGWRSSSASLRRGGASRAAA